MCQSEARLWQKRVKVDPSSSIKYQDIESEVQEQKVEGWDKDAVMKERLRAVISARQHEETKEMTAGQVKEVAGKCSNTWTAASSLHGASKWRQ